MTYMTVTKIDDALKYIQAEVAEKDKRLEVLCGGKIESKSYRLYSNEVNKFLNEMKVLYNDTDKHFTYLSKEGVATKEKELYEKLDNLKVLIEDIDKHNIEVSEYNKKIRETIKMFMMNFGIPEHYFINDPKSRARYPKSKRIDSGYIEDLNKKFPIGPAQFIKPNIEDYKRKVTTAANLRLKEIEAAEIEKKFEENKRKQIVFITEFYKKYHEIKENFYDTVANLDQYSLLQDIINRNKYLRLAYYLHQNRLDWSDGYGYAETGIDGFEVATDEDKDIIQYLRSLIEDWDGDGRVFRDCKYSYEFLYDKVKNEDPEIYSWYVKYVQLFPSY